MPWHERWRTLVQLAETALAIGLWAAALAAASDLVISGFLLFGGFIVVMLEIFSNPKTGRVLKAFFVIAAVIFFGSSEVLIAWRHQVDAAAPSPEAEKAGYMAAQRDQARAELAARDREYNAISAAPKTRKQIVKSLKNGTF